MASFAGAGGQTWVGHLFVFADEVLDHTFLGGDLAHGSKVDVAELFDVEGSAVLCLVSVACLAGMGVGEGNNICKRK